jgi:hypothetical protein
MARYKGAKPATARGSEPVSKSDKLGGVVGVQASPNQTKVQPAAIVAAPNGKGADEEKLRRILVEAHRLAGIAPGEWRIWIEGSAERYGVTRSYLEDIVTDIMKANTAQANARAAEDRRIEKRAEKQRATAQREQEREQRLIEKEAERKSKAKLKEFATIQKLPTAERELRLSELAKRFDEDLDIVRDEFADCVGADAHTDLGYIEPWPEPIETQALLLELMTQVRRYVVLHDEGALAIVLWVMMAWLHAEIATHSPILVLTSAEENSGKTTCAGVLALLTPRPYSAIEMTGPGLFHVVDERHPTLIVDEADKLFPRRTDLVHIVNAGWTRGAKIPRLVHGAVREFDVFCPKIVGMKGFDLPSTTASRAIVIELFPKLPEERVEDFKFTDDDAFMTLRRKLARWSMDNAAALKDATPMMPPGFGNRLAQNWRLLFAIADLTDDKQAARAAAVKLSRKTVKRSEGVRLLDALRRMLADACDETLPGSLMPRFAPIAEVITSDEIVRRLNADPEAEWRAFRGRGPITQRQVAALLAAYNIHPGVVHPTKRSDLSRRGYRREQFDEAFRRYLPPDPNM